MNRVIKPGNQRLCILLALVFTAGLALHTVPTMAASQASLVTWTLNGVTHFEFGETADGYFTIDQAIQPSENLAGYNITITGGSNPNIPNITFSDTDKGCLVACARLLGGGPSGSSILDFRTPLATDNTFYELVLFIEATVNELIFPRSAELVVMSRRTGIQYNRYNPEQNDVSQLSVSSLTADGKIITSAAVQAVQIDIKPGSFPNSINPRSKGVIPVAILTTNATNNTDTFDATTVNPITVRFGSTGTEAAPVKYALEDVDGDGDIDLILHFNTQDTSIKCGNTSATLTGKTFGGQVIQGTDSIKTVGCRFK